MQHQRIEGEQTLMRIHIGEDDKWHGKRLSRALIDLFQQEGLCGCTVFRGVGGYGSSHGHQSRYKTTLTLDLCKDLPLIVEVVDYPERIESILPKVDEMLSTGLITVERARVIFYRPHQ